MNLSRNVLSGSAALRDAAYSFVAAFSGKVGLDSAMVRTITDFPGDLFSTFFFTQWWENWEILLQKAHYYLELPYLFLKNV